MRCFSLYILDVPEASLAEDKMFYVVEEKKACETDEFAPKVLFIIYYTGKYLKF